MPYSIKVIIDNGGPAGHMYVVLTGEGSGEAPTEYGYNPVAADGMVEIIDNGRIKNNETDSRNAQYPDIERITREIPVTQQQYENAKSYAESVKQYPGQYNGQGEATGLNGGQNCVDFVDNVLDAAQQNSAGELFTDEELSNFKLAGFYADLRHGDASLIGVVGDVIQGAQSAAAEISGAIKQMAEDLARALLTPVCVDLDNDGLEYIANTATSGVFFDIDADGFAEKTEWIAPDDGFLVRDLNNNGVIDSQAEMFGDNGGTTAYAKLAALNTNNTGAITNDNYPCLTFPLTKIA
jgi:hypothetical protein